MCLAVPALITKIEGTTAEVDLGGVIREANILFTPEAGVGDYIVMHAGYALSVMDRREAEETLEILGQLAEADESH